MPEEMEMIAKVLVIDFTLIVAICITISLQLTIREINIGVTTLVQAHSAETESASEPDSESAVDEESTE